MFVAVFKTFFFTPCPVILFHQALQCFQEAATEVEKEEFLLRLTGAEEEEVTAASRLQYYNKVTMD